MTAQQPTKSPPAASFKTFKQALLYKLEQRRKNEHKVERQGKHAMTDYKKYQQQQQKQKEATSAMHMVEPDSRVAQGGRHTPPSPVLGHTANATTNDGIVASPAPLPLDGRVAVPVSPLSFPTHDTAQHATSKLAAEAAKGTAVVITGVTSGVARSSFSGAAVTASSAAVMIPQTTAAGLLPSPRPTMNEKADTGGRDKTVATAAAVDPAVVWSDKKVTPPNPVPVRLGRGRKLCPNCHALTKSAVKQCRECKHFFSPASSRLRAPPREPKENEEVSIPARRRLRPSQRLIEYELYEASSASAASAVAAAAAAGGDGRSQTAARRPLGASSTGGGVNQRVTSGGGGGRAATAGNGGMAAKNLASSSCEAGGARPAADGTLQPPKRSHKRKVSLSPGVATSKRRNASAAAAQSQDMSSSIPEATERAMGGPSGVLPYLSLSDRQRVAEDLLAASPTMRTVVPNSPELGPASATPAGPLLFLSPAASLEEDPAWLSAPATASSAARPFSPSAFVSPSTAVESPLPPFTVAATTLLAATHQHHRSSCIVVPTSVMATASSPSCTGAGELGPCTAASVTDILMGNDVHQALERELERRRREKLIDLSTERQDRDSFDGVELWLNDVHEFKGGSSSSGSGVSYGEDAAQAAKSVPVETTVFPTAGVSGTFEQRVFPAEHGMELLDDTVGDLMWSPANTLPLSAGNRSISGGGSSSSNNHGGVNSNGFLGLWLDGSDGVTVPCHRVTTTESTDASFPNFERGAALAFLATHGGSAGDGSTSGGGLRPQGGESTSTTL